MRISYTNAVEFQQPIVSIQMTLLSQSFHPDIWIAGGLWCLRAREKLPCSLSPTPLPVVDPEVASIAHLCTERTQRCAYTLHTPVPSFLPNPGLTLKEWVITPWRRKLDSYFYVHWEEKLPRFPPPAPLLSPTDTTVQSPMPSMQTAQILHWTRSPPQRGSTSHRHWWPWSPGYTRQWNWGPRRPHHPGNGSHLWRETSGQKSLLLKSMINSLHIPMNEQNESFKTTGKPKHIAICLLKEFG